MIRKLAGTVAAIAVVAIPASIATGDGSTPTAETYAAKGKLVAKDHAKDNPAAAAARVNLTDPGKVSYSISGSPGDVKVDWGITIRCVKGSLIDYFPGPGDFKTGTKTAGFGGVYPKLPLADPDFCTFAVAAQTFENDAGKGVTVKIYNK